MKTTKDVLVVLAMACFIAAVAGCQKTTPQQAAEKQRTAEEESAAAVQRAEEKRCHEAVSVYRNAPPCARTALNAVKKVEARTEVGINYEDYSRVVGEAWGDVKAFVDAPEGKKLSEFSFLLRSAIDKYRLAKDVWHTKIQRDLKYGEPTSVSSELYRQCWEAANRRIAAAESLLSGDDIAAALVRALRLQKADASYEHVVGLILESPRVLSTTEVSQKMAEIDADHE